MKTETKTVTVVKLTVEAGMLHTPNSAIVDKLQKEWAEGKDSLLCERDETGDPFTAKWPRPNEKNLRTLLYGAREMGLIPHVTEVELPNGRMFQID